MRQIFWLKEGLTQGVATRLARPRHRLFEWAQGKIFPTGATRATLLLLAVLAATLAVRPAHGADTVTRDPADHGLGHAIPAEQNPAQLRYFTDKGEEVLLDPFARGGEGTTYLAAFYPTNGELPYTLVAKQLHSQRTEPGQTLKLELSEGASKTIKVEGNRFIFPSNSYDRHLRAYRFYRELETRRARENKSITYLVRHHEPIAINAYWYDQNGNRLPGEPKTLHLFLYDIGTPLKSEARHFALVDENGSPIPDKTRFRVHLHRAAKALLGMGGAIRDLADIGVVDRDFKNSNLILYSPDRPGYQPSIGDLDKSKAIVAKIDLGMAVKKRTALERPTSAGTPGYMPTESVKPSSLEKQGTITDIYAAAITLYSLIMPAQFREFQRNLKPREGKHYFSPKTIREDMEALQRHEESLDLSLQERKVLKVITHFVSNGSQLDHRERDLKFRSPSGDSVFFIDNKDRLQIDPDFEALASKPLAIELDCAENAELMSESLQHMSL